MPQLSDAEIDALEISPSSPTTTTRSQPRVLTDDLIDAIPASSAATPPANPQPATGARALSEQAIDQLQPMAPPAGRPLGYDTTRAASGGAGATGLRPNTFGEASDLLTEAGEALPTARKIGEVAGYAGRGTRAALADAFGIGRSIGMRTSPNLENLKAFWEGVPAEGTRQTPLPLDVERQGMGTAGKVALGIPLAVAETAPKIAAIGATGAGAAVAGLGRMGVLLTEAFTAGGLFGLDEEGDFHPKQAAVGALLPGVGAVARAGVAKAIGTTLSKGLAAPLVNPTAQKLLETLGEQASLNAFTLAMESPELAELYRTNPKEFQAHLTELIGSNLAFGLLGARDLMSKEIPSATRQWIVENADRLSQRQILQSIPPDVLADLYQRANSPDPAAATPAERDVWGLIQRNLVPGGEPFKKGVLIVSEEWPGLLARTLGIPEQRGYAIASEVPVVGGRKRALLATPEAQRTEGTTTTTEGEANANREQEAVAQAGAEQAGGVSTAGAGATGAVQPAAQPGAKPGTAAQVPQETQPAVELKPDMATARRVAVMSPEELLRAFPQGSGGFNHLNIPLGQNVNDTELEGLRILQRRAEGRLEAATKTAARTRRPEDLETLAVLSTLPQFFSEAIKAAEEKRAVAEPIEATKPPVLTASKARASRVARLRSMLDRLDARMERVRERMDASDELDASERLGYVLNGLEDRKFRLTKQLNEAELAASGKATDQYYFGKHPLGITKAQYAEMTKLNDYQQVAKWGYSIAMLIEKAVTGTMPAPPRPPKVKGGKAGKAPPTDAEIDQLPTTPQPDLTVLEGKPTVPSNVNQPAKGPGGGERAGGGQPAAAGAAGPERGTAGAAAGPGQPVQPGVRPADEGVGGQPRAGGGGEPAAAVNRVPAARGTEGSEGTEQRPGTAGGGNVAPVRSEPAETGGALKPAGEVEVPAEKPVTPELRPEQKNLRLTENPAPTGPVARVNANLRAIELVKDLEAEKRLPTEEERKELAAWSGWGSFKELFNEGKAERRDYDLGWAKRYGKAFDKLKRLLSDGEFLAAAESSVNAHYTSPEAIRAMWALVKRLGFKGGRVLEPAVGRGDFLGFTPEDLYRQVKWTAVEMEPITAKIAAYLYPEADVRGQPFENAKLPRGYFDLVLTNVPFHETGPGKEYPTMNLHNYFIARSLDMVRPGGLVVVITSKNTMDAFARGFEQRKLLAEKGQLIGAIRLPNNAFKESADTEVVTDILVLRKPDGKPFEAAHNWLNTSEQKLLNEHGAELPYELNEYYVAHPEMVLGKQTMEGTMYGASRRSYGPQGEYTVVGSGDLADKLAAAIRQLPEGIIEGRGLKVESTEVEAERTFLEDYTLSLNAKGQLVEAGNYQLGPVTSWDGKNATLVKRAKEYVRLRDALLRQYALERDPQSSDQAIEDNRKLLRAAYDGWKRANGTLNQNSRKTEYLASDPGYYTVMGLENVTEEADPNDASKTRTVIKPATVLSQRMIVPDVAPAHAANAEDALGISLSYRGELDLDYIRELTGLTEEQIEAQLVGASLAYKDPESGQLLTATEYLTGEVRDKLAKATFAAKDNEMYARNVAALQSVIPPNVPFDRIAVDISARWTPTSVLNKFAVQALGLPENVVRFVPVVEEFAIAPVPEHRLSALASSQWSSDRMKAPELLQHAMNFKRAQIWDYTDEDKRVLNESATALANELIKKIKDQYAEWLRTTKDTVGYRYFDQNAGDYRTDQLPIWDVMEREFNRKANSFVVPDHDGTHLKLPGLSGAVRRTQHLLNGVQRAINAGSAVFAHGVGSGKTFLGLALGHELQRIGLSKKFVHVIKKPTVDQYRVSIQRAYPGSRMLVPSKKDFEKANRQKLLARIASTKWDFIILTHEQFKSISPGEELVQGFFDEQIQQLRQILKENGGSERDEGAKSTRGMDPTVRNIVRKIKGLKKRRDQHLDSIKKHQDKVNWENLGIDGLFIDESHNFKKMPLVTNMEGDVKGIPSDFSQRAVDLLVKVRDIQRQTQGRNIFFASGTPVSNTLAELWVQFHAVSPKLLSEFSVSTFDSFASTYADVVTNFEMAWDGSFRDITRMSRFKNPAGLTTLTRLGMDVKIGNKELGLDVPDIEGGKPKIVTIKPTKAFERWIRLLEQIAEEWEGLDPKGRFLNSWVPITTMTAGVAAALDARCVFPDAPDDPNSKVNTAVGQIFGEWEAGKASRTTMMVFADLYRTISTEKLMQFLGGEAAPQAASEALDVEGEAARSDQEGDPGAAEEAAYEQAAVGEFSLYNDLRAKLIARGVPEHEIGIITEHETDAKRDALFNKVRNGMVRILIGSTEKIGEGVDVPQRMSAQFHLDPPRAMTGAKLEQRLGRIIRQGNMHSPKNLNLPVRLFFYAQERSMDAAIYQLLENKSTMTIQVLKGAFLGDTFDDPMSDLTITMAELKAASTGDGRSITLARLTQRVRELSVEEGAYYRRVSELRRSIDESQREARAAREIAATNQKVGAVAAETAADPDRLTLLHIHTQTRVTGEEQIKEWLKKARVAIEEKLKEPGSNTGLSVLLGDKLRVRYEGRHEARTGYQDVEEKGKMVRKAIAISGDLKQSLTFYLGKASEPEFDDPRYDSEVSSIESLVTVLGNIPKRTAERAEKKLELAQQQDELAAAYEKQLENTRFEKAQELKETAAEMNRLQSELRGERDLRRAAAQAKKKGEQLDLGSGKQASIGYGFEHGDPGERGGLENPARAARAADAYLRASPGADPSLFEGEGAAGRQSGPFRVWAAANGLVLPPDTFAGLPVISQRTTEHEVLLDRENGLVIKRTKFGGFGYIPDVEEGVLIRRRATPVEYLQRLALQNQVFAERMTFVGVQDGRHGPVLVTAQRFAGALEVTKPNPTRKELAEFLEREGFQLDPIGAEIGGWRRDADGVLISDARPDNFVKTSAGIVPIDLQMGRLPGKASVEAGAVPATNGPELRAQGLEELRELLSHPKAGLSGDAVRVALDLLDQPVMQDLDWSKLRLELKNRLEGKVAGAADVSHWLIEMTRAARPTTLPHEIFHFLYELLPDADKDRVDQLRREALQAEVAKWGMGMPLEVRTAIETMAAGMSSDTFLKLIERLKDDHQQSAEWLLSVYHMINPSEFLAGIAAGQFSRESFSKRHQTWLGKLMDRLRRWLAGLLDAFKRLRGAAPDVQQLIRELLAGKYRNRPEGGRAAEETARRGAGGRQFEPEPNVPTVVFGVEDFVRGRERITPDSTKASVDYAKTIFDAAQVPVLLDEQGLWVIENPGFDLNAEGRRLLGLLRKEIAGKNEAGKAGDLLASLLNAVVYNFKLGTMEVFDRPLREELYALAQADRSQRGLALGALAMHKPDAVFVAQNLDVALARVWSDAYGGEQVRSILGRVLEHFRDWFSDQEINQALANRPELAELVDKLIALKRKDEGGRVYRRAQAMLAPKMKKTLARLEGDARVEEAVAHIIENARRMGIEPKANPNKKLSPLQSLLVMVTPETAEKIDAAVSQAVSEAERNAGIKATLKAAANEMEREELRARFGAGEEPEAEMIEEGLKLPEYAHWKWLRDGLLGYSPTTLKLAQDLIKADFKGARFGPATVRAAETRIDLEKLAKQPEAEIARGLEAYLDNLNANMELAGATDETKERVSGLIEGQIVQQIEQLRGRLRDVLFQEPKATAATGSVTAPRPTPQEAAEAKVGELVNAKLFADPRLDVPELVGRVAGKTKLRRLAPTITDLVKDVLATPFFRQAELGQMFAAGLIERLGIAPEQAEHARAVFEETFRAPFEKARAKALQQAREGLTPLERKAVRPGAALWIRIERMVNAGGFDTGALLQEMARAKGWSVPTEQQVRHMRNLAEREMRLRELTPQEKAVAGDDPRALERALADRAAATLEKRAALVRQMGTIWARFTKPLTGRHLWANRRNIAAAANEFEVADMLLKVGFAFRLPTHILTQLLVHIPTRGVGQALINHREALSRGEISSVLKEAAQSLGEAYKQALRGLRPALMSAQAAMAGRGEARNVDRLMTGIHLFERVEAKAAEYAARGDWGRATFLRLTGLVRFSLRFVQAVDNFQGVPAEYQELRAQVRNGLREQGRSPAEIAGAIDRVFSGMKLKRDAALAKARDLLNLSQEPFTDKELRETAWNIVRARLYEDVRDLGLPADSFREMNEKLRRTIAWQERVVHGPGGLVATVGRGASSLLQEVGLPLSFVRFANAIGNGINYMLMFTPAYALANSRIPGVTPNEPSPWFETAEDVMQRRVQAVLGSIAGALIIALVLSGAVVVRLFWPKDKEERDLWEAQGHRPGTLEIRINDHEFIPLSLTVGPGSIVAPYAAAAGAVVDMFAQREKAQKKLNLEAEQRGLTPGKVRELEATDWLTVAAQAAWGTLMGNKALAGVGQSMSEFGIPNSRKTVAAYASPLVPGLPAWQEFSRMLGVQMDSKIASFWDYLVPLPTSGARAVNMVGEPVGTPDAVQRVFQSIFAGSYPWVVDEKAGRTGPYAALFATGYRPPSIDAGKGYAIGGEFRPLTDEELMRYSEVRGKNLAREFSELGSGADLPGMKGAYQRANVAALESVGVDTAVRPISANAATAQGQGQAIGALGRVSPYRALGLVSGATAGRGRRISRPRAGSAGGSLRSRASLTRRPTAGAAGLHRSLRPKTGLTGVRMAAGGARKRSLGAGSVNRRAKV